MDDFDAMLADLKAKDAAMEAAKAQAKSSADALAVAKADSDAKNADALSAHQAFEASVETFRDALEAFKMAN